MAAGEGGHAFPAFPYPPYNIQLDFMQALYSALDAGGVGLFESPTGTGKTLSLICSSLQWLRDQRQREAAAAAAAPAAGDAATASGQAAGDAAAAGGAADGDDAPDWMLDFAAQQEREQQQQRQERRAARIARAKAKLQAGAGGLNGGTQRGRAAQAGGAAKGAAEDDVDAEYLMDGGQSGGSDAERSGARAGGKRSPGTAGLGRGPGSSSGSESGSGGEGAGLGEAEQQEGPPKRQIIFASRTHSQLSQFVGELHRTPFADDMSLVALGSRKALCINDDVLRLQSAPLINERCLELQKPGSSGSRKAAAAAGQGDVSVPQRRAASRRGGGTSGRCPYLATGSQAASTTRDMILAQPMDIEELAKLGRRKSVCPYYSARRAVAEADIILAPYSCLLVRETRQALGLRLDGNVVIVDEGHNLVDAINSSHSAELSAAQADTAHRQLSAYFRRFQGRLSPGNCRHIQTLLRVAQVLGQAASGSVRGAAGSASLGTANASSSGGGSSSGSGSVLTVNDFLLQTSLDNLNLFKLVSHVRETKAVYKIAGFWQSQQKQQAEASAAAAAEGGGPAASAAADSGGAGTGALHALVGFLQCLTNADADGRIVVQPAAPAAVERQPPRASVGGGALKSGATLRAASSGSSSGSGGGGQLKYVLLNAAAHFGEVVSAAHAVVLASGTLSPLQSVLHLFPGVPPHRLHRFACGHVVAQERLLALAVGTGPSGTTLDFRHSSRGSPATMDELGRVVLNTCQVVPGGVVVFFPSFSYADQVHARWQQSGLLRQLGARKRVFQEPRSAAEVEASLQQYADCISAAAAAAGGGGKGGGGGITGAVLLSVVGGKLAEGINFGDALGRCVIMVGLPYPNPSDPELQERMAFMDRAAAAAAAGPAAMPAAAAALLAADSSGHAPQSACSTADAGGVLAASSTAAAGTAGGCLSAQGTPSAAAARPAAAAAAHPAAVAAAACPSLAAETGREYYTNLCMKAVNQCVGRVIRHRSDWAAVLLVDCRYAAAVDARGGFTGPLAKLPGWIQQSLRVSRSFGDAFGQLARFSRGMAAAEAAQAAQG